jgi:hypothetical protein
VASHLCARYLGDLQLTALAVIAEISVLQ